MLQHLRTERGFSLRELGVLADLDHAYIYRLETGDKESPSEEVMAKLLRALKAARRESDMLRFLSQHSQTDPALVSHVLSDPTVTYQVFASVAGAAFRGAVRPDYAKLIARVRRILDEEEDHG
jgi:transcriptional regulator with XRE-family HTH domain